MDSVSGCNPFQRSSGTLLAILPLSLRRFQFPIPVGLTAIKRVQMTEDAWNSRDPERVALAYSPDSGWRNDTEFIRGRDEIKAFLRQPVSTTLRSRRASVAC